MAGIWFQREGLIKPKHVISSWRFSPEDKELKSSVKRAQGSRSSELAEVGRLDHMARG